MHDDDDEGRTGVSDVLSVTVNAAGPSAVASVKPPLLPASSAAPANRSRRTTIYVQTKASNALP